MVFGILSAVGAMSSILDWAEDTSIAIREEEKQKAAQALRAMAGAAARGAGKEEKVHTERFVRVPGGDPALGGGEVLMTHEEAIWWMGASRDERMSKHVRKIRRILKAQPERRKGVS